ncbi:MAG: zinc ribbon-containing protein [Proteobacteria bacterium]|nr:zinc ribbon-containing protein [Pseudomonadota bacterium]MBU1641657.1 zinc ribbon-containing protein [Pseudomonadota bacterium]
MADKKKENKAVEEELAVYEKLRQRVSKTFGELNDKINTESITHAMEKAVAELKQMGEHSKDLISRAGEALRKDISSSVSQIKPKVEEDIEETRKDFTRLHNKGGALWREISNEAEHIKKLSLDKSGAFLLNVTRGLSEWTKSISDKLDSSLSYKTGEVTHGGEFTCTSCGAKLNLKNPGRLPPCPKCSKTEFRRS